MVRLRLQVKSMRESIVVLFVLVSTAVSINLVPPPGINGTITTSLSNQSTSPFPQNLSEIYKGNWVFLNSSTSSSPAAANYIASSLTEEGPLGLKHNSGHTLFSLEQIKSIPHNIDIIEGELVIRDGVYSSRTSLKYLLSGVYYKDSGTLYLSAKPIDDTGGFAIQDVVGSNWTISSHETFGRVGIDITLDQAFDSVESSMKLLRHGFRTYCPLRIHLQLQLPTPANDNLRDQQQVSKLTSIRNSELLTKEEDLNGDTTTGKHEIQFEGYFRGYGECDALIRVDATKIKMTKYYSKWIDYIIMVSVTSFVQIIALMKQIEYSGTMAGAAKVSLISIGMQAVMDSYLCLVHLTAGIVIDSMFNAFATAAFFQFVTFSIFEMRYLLIILKSRRSNTNEGWASIRREFSMFYLRFYTMLVFGFMVLYYLHQLFHVFLMLMFSFWVPQIVSNATLRSRRPLQWNYIIGMSVTRLAIPLYFYACPHNFVPSQPDYPIAFALVSWMSIQVAVLHLQERWGPQFFVPKRFLPARYDYFRVIPSSIPADLRNCVVCMCEVETARLDHMITPCDHVFHHTCLEQWMEMKLECPFCRRSLPQP